jgi:hypothetical protein
MERAVLLLSPLRACRTVVVKDGLKAAADASSIQERAIGNFIFSILLLSDI